MPSNGIHLTRGDHDVTSTERERAWRLGNPERSRSAERERALARRRGYWGEAELGVVPTVCHSSDSYWRYETITRPAKQWEAFLDTLDPRMRAVVESIPLGASIDDTFAAIHAADCPVYRP